MKHFCGCISGEFGYHCEVGQSGVAHAIYAKMKHYEDEHERSDDDKELLPVVINVSFNPKDETKLKETSQDNYSISFSLDDGQCIAYDAYNNALNGIPYLAVDVILDTTFSYLSIPMITEATRRASMYAQHILAGDADTSTYFKLPEIDNDDKVEYLANQLGNIWDKNYAVMIFVNSGRTVNHWFKEAIYDDVMAPIIQSYPYDAYDMKFSDVSFYMTMDAYPGETGSPVTKKKKKNKKHKKGKE